MRRWDNCAPDLAKQIPNNGPGGIDFWMCLFLCLTCCLIGLCCLIPYQSHRVKKIGKIAIEWRDLFIQEMQDFIQNDLETRYPHLTFTLIYPVVIYQTLVTVTKRNGRTVNQTQRPVPQNVYCYIRISDAPLPIGDSYEPSIYSTNNGNNIGIVAGNNEGAMIIPQNSARNVNATDSTPLIVGIGGQ